MISPSQRPAELFAKRDIYHEWGVDYCWVIDPRAKRAWEYHAREAASELNGPASVSIQELFA